MINTDVYATDDPALPNKTLLIPVLEEQLVIGKVEKKTGRIRIEKHVSESRETADVSLFHDEHSVEHVLQNIYVDTIPVMQQEGNTIIIPVLKEVLVKRTLLVEEIRITKQSVQANEHQDVTLRKEHVTIEHVL